MKTCKACEMHLPFSSFYVSKQTKDGLRGKCKTCVSKEGAKYYSENIETVKSRHQSYARLNRDKARQRMARYRKETPGLGKESMQRWQKENRARLSAVQMQRHASKLRATPRWADQKAIETFYQTAYFTGEEVDHIVPLKSKFVCGLHCEFNLQILPAFANRSKSNRYWPNMWPEEKA